MIIKDTQKYEWWESAVIGSVLLISAPATWCVADDSSHSNL